MWNIKSPDGKLNFSVYMNGHNRLFYSLKKYETEILRDCGLGIQTSMGDFSRDFVLKDQLTCTVDEKYSIPAGKKSVYHNNANELCLLFEAENPFTLKHSFILRIRVFDDGAAFRYELPAGSREEGSREFAIYSENTEISFAPQYNNMWLQELVDTYEAPYGKRSWLEAKGRNYGMPGLFSDDDRKSWIMITEAGLLNTGGSYCSCHLTGAGERKLSVAFAPEQTGPMTGKLPFESPWRVIGVFDSLNELVNSTLNYNLNPASVIEDTSWIKPSRNIWSWWSFENGAQLYSEQKRYVDFAAALGFESVTVDAGWDDSWVKALCHYAREKGVTVWLWSDMQAVDTFEKASEKIARWAEWGVVGLKVDFFMNDSQHTMWQYNMIADIMTGHKLMINFHGSTKPAGEGRTYPNLMTEEGIMGLEHYKWSGMPDAVHNCTVPFTRNVVGPMDYTVTGFSNENRNTTQGHQLALSVVYESGVQHISESIYHLEAWKGTEYLRRQYPRYDGMQLLKGFPGEYAAMLRYVGREWFIGCITADARTIELSMDFLPAGEFTAEIYRDDSEGNMLVKESRTITGGDVLTLELLACGGAAVYISDGSVKLKSGVCSGYMSDRKTCCTAENASLKGTSALMAYENGDWAVVLKDKAVFENIAAERDGRHTLRITYASQNKSAVRLKTEEGTLDAELPASGGKKVFRTFDVVMSFRKGINSIEIGKVSGDGPAVGKIELIDNAPNPDRFYTVDMAKTEGGVDIIPVCENSQQLKAAGIGNGGSIVFERIEADEQGEYVLGIDYCSGENRPVMISVNGAAPITSVLFNTSGWGPSRWDIIETKEVKVNLMKGINSIKFFHDSMPAPQIVRIAIRFEK